MKVCLVQPYYSIDYADADKCFEDFLALIDKCDDTMDMIVLPEYSDVPTSVPSHKDFYDSCAVRGPIIRQKAIDTAKRCHAMVFANYAYTYEKGLINATHTFDREGNEIGVYFKEHPAPSEIANEYMDSEYSYTYHEPYILETEGLRIGFMTCYDFYMYENFPRLARMEPDIIIGCSHQRTDAHSTLDVIGRFLTYNTNAYLCRSSVTLGDDSPVCGCSMIAAPDGSMILDMKNETGIACAEIDPHAHYYKPAGFKGAMKAHWQYIEDGRRPWLYKPAGSMMLPDEEHLKYPRICAHRGFNSIAPENSMPAFGAAVALGAEEIEFDLWATKDGYLVSAHDLNLERISDGTGRICDYTLEELRAFDFGVKKGEAFKGLRVLLFEDILKKFACTVIMNIHVKLWDYEFPNRYYNEIASLLRQYCCEKHCYMMSSSDSSLAEFHEIAPEIARCVGFDGNKEDMLAMVRRAEKLGAEKIQLFKPYFNEETVRTAKEKGILTNVFFADDPQEAIRYSDMGIDCILTNDYLSVSNALRGHWNAK